MDEMYIIKKNDKEKLPKVYIPYKIIVTNLRLITVKRNIIHPFVKSIGFLIMNIIIYIVIRLKEKEIIFSLQLNEIKPIQNDY